MDENINSILSSSLTAKATSTMRENISSHKYVSMTSLMRTDEDICEESSAFEKILNISDLDRDELYLKQNWTYLPVQKFNISLTGPQNSVSNAPLFMPAEDSLFKELDRSNTTSAGLSFNETQKKGLNSTYTVPSLHDISLILCKYNIDVDPNIIMNEILQSGKMSDETDRDNEQSICPEGEIQDNENLSLQQMLTFSSVDIGDNQSRVVHLLNSSKSRVAFKCLIEGDDAYCLSDNSTATSLSLTLEPGIREIFIKFTPTCVGAALALLTIEAGGSRKEVPIIGYAGTSMLTFLYSYSNMKDERKFLELSVDSSSQLKLKNFGNAPAFYSISIGDMRCFCHINNRYGIINPGKTTDIDVSLIKKRKALSKLLNFFTDSDLVEIGKVTISFGEESIRQRIQRLYNSSTDSVLGRTVRRNFMYLLKEYPQVNMNLENLSDSIDSFPFLIHEGIHQTNVTLKLRMRYIIQLLTNLS